MNTNLSSVFRFLFSVVALTAFIVFASATTLPAQISGSIIDAPGGVKGKPTPTPSPILDPHWIGTGAAGTGQSWNTSTNWNPNGVPNGATAAVDYQPSAANATAMLTNQDVPGGATVGSISLQGTGAQGWTITSTTPTTLNNSGAGALISNQDSAVSNGNTYRLTIAQSAAANALVLADNLTISNTSGSTNPNGSISITAAINGTGNINITNVSNDPTHGQIILAPATNSGFNGSTTVSSGAVTFNSARSFGLTANQVNLGVTNGASATLEGTAAITLANPIAVASSGSGTFILGASANTTFSGTVSLAGSVSLTSTAANNVTFSNVISGAGGITKIDTGTVTLSGGNTYAGDTAISAGTLKLGAANVIPDGSGKGNVSVTGTLDLNTFSETINGLSGAGTVDTIAGGTPTLTVGNNNQTSTFSGVIKNTAGTLALTKTGSGTLKLTNDNTYSGQTTVSNGTLEVNNTGTTGKLVNTTSIVVNNGGTLLLSGSASVNDRLNNNAGISLNGGATLRAAGVSEGTTGAAGFGMGALTLSGAAASVATIDFSGTSGILNFNGFSQTNNGSILNITNWVGKVAAEGGGGAEQLLFVGSASTFQTTFTQSEIEFDGVAGYRIVDHGTWFEVTAIPEPSTWVAAALAAAVIGYTLRRRFTRVLARA